MSCLLPFFVGVIWCLWHYHYFMFDGMDVPLVWFFQSCIVESYIYGYLLELTDNNLIFAMIYHFVWNLFIHIFAMNPADNRENHTQYICGIYGRCICIEHDSKRGLQRWNFPFKTLEIEKKAK